MKTFRILAGKHFPKGVVLEELLVKISGLQSQKLHEAAKKGAVWVQKGKGKILRERNLKAYIRATDTVSLFYDPKVLSLPEASGAECLENNNRYSVWYKPAGLLSQGTQAGDHTSLLRHAETSLNKEVFLVHRLDRETAGVMAIAHTSEAAAKLSDMFQKNMVKKVYEALVLGPMTVGEKATIDFSLDNKNAVTHFEVLESSEDRSLLKIEIETGRLHQIRRHLDLAGHPVLGDPKYGRGNKNNEGLKLLAKTLAFTDPWEKTSKIWVTAHTLKSRVSSIRTD